MFGQESLVVDSVSGLVEDAEERLIEEPRIVARGDATIPWSDPGAERVRGHVEPPGLEVEADGFRGPASKCLLDFDWVFAFEDLARGPASRWTDGRDKRHQLGRQRREHAPDLRGRRPGLVLVEQGIVRVVLVTDRVGLAPLESDNLLEPRTERREVTLRSRLLPDLLCPRGHPRQFLDEFLRQ